MCQIIADVIQNLNLRFNELAISFDIFFLENGLKKVAALGIAEELNVSSKLLYLNVCLKYGIVQIYI